MRCAIGQIRWQGEAPQLAGVMEHVLIELTEGNRHLIVCAVSPEEREELGEGKGGLLDLRCGIRYLFSLWTFCGASLSFAEDAPKYHTTVPQSLSCFALLY